MKTTWRLIQIALIITGAVSSCSSATADIWAGQVKQIEILEKQGQLPQARLATTHLIEDLKRLDPGNGLLTQAIDRKASIEQDLGQYREAERDYTEAINLWRSGHNGQSAGLATELNNLASLCSLTGQIKKAEALRRESLELRLHLLGPDNPEVALSYSNLAVDLFQEERYAESARLCQQALAIWSKTDPGHNRSDLAFNTRALIELHNRSPSTALPFALAAVAQYRANTNINPSTMASYEQTVALAREAAGQLDYSEQDFRNAIALLEGQNSPSLIRIGLFADYAHLLNQLKRTKEAKHLLHRAELEMNTLAKENQWQHTVDLKALLPNRTNER